MSQFMHPYVVNAIENTICNSFWKKSWLFFHMFHLLAYMALHFSNLCNILRYSVFDNNNKTAQIPIKRFKKIVYRFFF